MFSFNPCIIFIINSLPIFFVGVVLSIRESHAGIVTTLGTDALGPLAQPV